MKRWLLLVLIAIVVIGGGIIGIALANDGKDAPKSQMDDYVNMVKLLQKGDSESRDSVSTFLKSRKGWTLLDEIGDYDVDEIDEHMMLKLNDMAYEAASPRLALYGSPKGVFVDGRDRNYDICFIEKCLAPGSEVVYNLTEREGLERVAVVEMNEGDLVVYLNTNEIDYSDDLVFRSEFNSSEAELRIRNRRSSYVSFVIINEH